MRPTELLDKAAQLPREIYWHFIGQLQTNKCRRLAEEIPNLWAVESVDTSKKADALEKGRVALAVRQPEAGKLRVYVQVNTSGKDPPLPLQHPFHFSPPISDRERWRTGESSKSGCTPSEAIGIARHIRETCPHLTLHGLMTIGSIARSQRSGDEENQDFLLLKETARDVEKELQLPEGDLELSMGMSSDFEQAITLGATSVRYVARLGAGVHCGLTVGNRVGTAIFGERPPKQDAQATRDVTTEQKE